MGERLLVCETKLLLHLRTINRNIISFFLIFMRYFLNIHIVNIVDVISECLTFLRNLVLFEVIPFLFQIIIFRYLFIARILLVFIILFSGLLFYLFLWMNIVTFLNPSFAFIDFEQLNHRHNCKNKDEHHF